MRNTRSMLGMPVLCNGQPVGRVAAVQLNDSLTGIQGIFLYSGVIGSRYIECADLDLVGEVAVLARAAGRRTKQKPRATLRRAIGPDGERIGAITDAVIDEESLSVTALELSRGYLEDLTNGRSRICNYSVCPDGEVLIDRTEGGTGS